MVPSPRTPPHDPSGPDCHRCRHHRITHDRARPYACQAFGFQSPRPPSQVVLAESGAPCQRFEPRAGGEAGSAGGAGGPGPGAGPRRPDGGRGTDLWA